jgi:hypothetical protein
MHSIRYLQILPQEAHDAEFQAAKRSLQQLIDDEVQGNAEGVVVRSGDPMERIIEEAGSSDLTVLGLNAGDQVFGSLLLEVARRTDNTMVVIGHYA